MKIGQIYHNDCVWFQITGKKDETWIVSEVWPKTRDCGMWHDMFQEWSQEQMDKQLEDFYLVDEYMEMDDLFVERWPKQITEI